LINTNVFSTLSENSNDKARIEESYQAICRCLIKEARKADNSKAHKQQSLAKRNGILLSCQESARIIKELKWWRQAKAANKYVGLANKRIRWCEKNLKRLNCTLLAKLRKNEANNIATLLKSNRSKFWREVKFKRQSVGRKFESKINIDEIRLIIENLKSNKSIGFDYISNEMLKYANSEILLIFLTRFYELVFNAGVVPNNFNTTVITPVPKKGATLSKAEDFRPISVSSEFTSVFERLVFNRLGKALSSIHQNQFGYRMNTSCKHAYFIANEVTNFFLKGKSSMYILSLDAHKAFDRLWRDGLFYKLINHAEQSIWRALYIYYQQSQIIVKANKQISQQKY
jgi:hypothetical protein